ncbi:BtrH N-terminal domain-containing protein [Actinosynnema sp. NPDC047251]|uniref:Butirosin biosynthesis protein H N-terminal domain-containing protein n=1 Tax=Saccharothrix espanaensis (strain ATCC 51144 / DSM 44229 / JCM 9112 / NBRC 15066 / NRRL 15764) TaxID=1179773 RepID=K0K7T6_SACES|nr:BtrH N-terminal domain-containing protein [Saccharothrix espanaensis]CCH32939.1 hypothetical protein BN6_56800 [Saccharothrix espanaensis DSM 44229]
MTGSQVEQWYRDPVSCVHATLAEVVRHAGAEPLEVLGLGWEFRHLPGDVRPEEYYWPCRVPGDLAGSVLPHHRVRSVWRTAPEPDPLTALTGPLAVGRLPVLAVDNYHLPFRPAYHDVHAAHLILVRDLDLDRGVALVSDAMPPAHRGELPVADLLRAWRSTMPPDEQDVFFSGRGGQARWLEVIVEAVPPPLTPEALRSALRANVDGFQSQGPERTGLAGFGEFLAEVVDRSAAGEAAAPAEVYTFGWSMQAQSAVHGELLRTCGMRWAEPELAEAGRRVEQVAHHWTALRVTGAHGRTDPVAAAPGLHRHGERLRRSYEQAVESLALASAAR